MAHWLVVWENFEQIAKLGTLHLNLYISINQRL